MSEATWPVAAIVIRGYPGRQWRKRVPVGEWREVGVAALPGDVQAEVRAIEKSTRKKHAVLRLRHGPDGEISVLVEFTVLRTVA